MSQADHFTSAPLPIYTTLPAALTSFVGRERERAEVARLMETARLVSLVGAGGCGKTRLALRVASEIAGQFADGVCWVDLTRLNDPALAPQAVAKALNMAEQPDVALIDAMLERLGTKHLLLVLDNCEHVLTACAELAVALLRGCAVTILTTTRESLGVEGEMIYPAQPLALPAARLPIVDAGQYDAIRLFVERAKGVRPDFTLTHDNANAVVEICRRLDGMPLAIELASARVGVLSVQQIAERLDSRLDLLVSPARPDERHRTLRAAIGWSYDLLSPAEQILLQRLSIFAAGFTLTLAEAACAWGAIQRNQIFELLASLVSKSLVVAETLQGSEARYRLLETIRQFAGEKLTTSGERAQAHDHFLGCYAQVADEIAPKLFGKFQQIWLAWLETEHDNFRVALTWAQQRGRCESGLRIALALFQYWLTRDYVREGFTWFERFFSRLDSAIPLAMHVNALTFATFLAGFLGEATAAATWSGRAVALCEAGGAAGRSLLGFALAGVDSAEEAAGNFDAAYATGEREIELDRASGDSLLLGMALFTQGMRATRLGRHEAARTYLDEALALARSDDDAYRIAHALNGLGDLARMGGRFAQAAVFYEKSLTSFSDLGATRDVPNVERHLAYAALRHGDAARAHALFCQSLEAHWARDNRAGALRSLLGLAAWADAVGMTAESACLSAFVMSKREMLKTTFDSGDWADQKDDEQLTATVRARLGEDRFDVAQAEGHAFTLEQAIHYALSLQPHSNPRAAEGNASDRVLTAREHEIVALIADGLTNGKIAGKLVLSKRTVEKHIANILSKLALTHRAQLVKWAMEHDMTK